jgi:hypothetical protein
MSDSCAIYKYNSIYPGRTYNNKLKAPYTVVIHVYGAYFMMMTQQVPAMCYVPWQRWDELYEPSRAIMRGTMFPVLDKPFTGGRS